MSLISYLIHLILTFNTYHRCDWQRTKKQENIRLHYVSLYIYFVTLLASAKKEMVRPTRLNQFPVVQREALGGEQTVLLLLTLGEPQ